MGSEKDGAAALEEAIARYNDAWNAHDLDAIMAMHAPDMVFENHTAGESAEGEAARGHIGAIFETWPDIDVQARRLYVRDGLVVQEWTAIRTSAATKAITNRGTEDIAYDEPPVRIELTTFSLPWKRSAD